jgi:hypothetical protein
MARLLTIPGRIPGTPKKRCREKPMTILWNSEDRG